MTWNKNRELFEIAFAPLTDDDRPDATSKQGKRKTASAALRAKVQSMASRSGNIDGVACVIEELADGVFIVHGFGEGPHVVEGTRCVDPEGDAQPESGPQVYHLIPIKESRFAGGVHAHVIREMTRGWEADQMFSTAMGWTWKVRLLDKPADQPSDPAEQSRVEC